MAARFLFCIIFSAYILTTSQVSGKECTNTGTELSSHTLRAQLMTSKNNTHRNHETNMISLYHSSPTDESIWMNSLPRKSLREKASEDEFNWARLYRSISNSDVVSVKKQRGKFLKEVSLHDVHLDPDSVYGHAQQTNLEYLLMLDVDRLVWSFRKQAGLPTPGIPYGGWEAPDCELRGHFVGHYMSASALMWASTHNETLYEKMSLTIDALNVCQTKMGTGYLSAFPPEFFDRFESIQSVWAPYYTIHKIMAGLLDQYLFVGNTQALQMVVWMAEYFGNRVKNVILKYSIERHWLSLNEETGGMNDVLYRLYNITGDQKHLILAHLFDKPCFLGLLAVKADSLSGFHVNTHIPVVIGAQMRYEITGDKVYKEIGTTFMQIVNSSHSYATGGTSVNEFWSDPKRLADTLQTENEESCTTYNMLKVSRNLFRWTKEIRYADYYERALMNGVLGIQRGRKPGVMIYMLPMGRGYSKARSYHGWGTEFDSFWCCYGTGIESFSKLGDSIYFEEESIPPGLYVIQFIPSSFNWKSGGVILNQKVKPVTSLDPFLQVELTISSTESVTRTSTLNLRIPFWTSLSGAKATLNGQVLHLPYPGNFLSLTRNWSLNNKLTLQLPTVLRTEAIKDDRPEFRSVQAILFGPYLLAGLSKGDWDIKRGDAHSMSNWVSAVPAAHKSQLISLTQVSSDKTFVLSSSNHSITMEGWPKAGTDSAIYATFRLFIPESKSSMALSIQDVIGQNVMLEPFHLPGMVVIHQGPNKNISISIASGVNSLFKVVQGLDGKGNTISLESVSQQGCFWYGGVDYSAGRSVELICMGDRTLEGASFQKATSFVLRRGMRQYHPISFTAKGATRNFLLEPLLSLRDESYTVYFNVGAKS